MISLLASAAGFVPARSPLPRASITMDTSAAVNELRSLVLPRSSSASKTDEQRNKIRELCEVLEQRGSSRDDYLSSASLFGNYEVAFFDKSVDGDRDSGYKNATRPFGLRSKLLGSLFSLRFSFQNVQSPNVVCNHVGLRLLGLPALVTARGEFEPLGAADVQSIADEHGTQLREATSVRITFDKPRVTLGPWWSPLSFELGGKAVQPPVDICVTYLDDKLRLGLAARGGRFVFTRGGLASKPYADNWERLLRRRPISGRGVALTAIAVAAMCAPAVRGLVRTAAAAALGAVVAR